MSDDLIFGPTEADQWARRAKLTLDPTTAETPTMREQLARTLYDMNKLHGLSGDWETCQGRCRAEWLRQVDAILREMLEPSEGMRRDLHMSAHDCRQWSAGVQHIIDEGLPTAEDVKGILK